MSSSEPSRHEVSSFEDVMGPASSYKSGKATIIHLNPDEKEYYYYLMCGGVIDLI